MLSSPAPASAAEVELQPRPHTVEPVQVLTIELSTDQLEAMDNNELTAWVWQHLGVALDPKWARGKLITELRRLATEILTLG